jgi:hypothetical protein
VRLAGAVQDVADQSAGEHPVDRFGDGAQRTGQPQPLGDGRGQLVRRRGDQPHLLTCVEMHLCQCTGARPDLVGDDLVEDLLAESHQLRGGAALDECQRLALPGRDIVAVLPADELKLGLRVDESAQVAIGEVLAGGQAPGEVHQGRPVHQRVVDVKKRRGGQVWRWGRRGGDGLHRKFGDGDLRAGLAG